MLAWIKPFTGAHEQWAAEDTPNGKNSTEGNADHVLKAHNAGHHPRYLHTHLTIHSERREAGVDMPILQTWKSRFKMAQPC